VNTYSGDTTISSGSIQLGSQGSLLNSTVVVNVNGGLTFAAGSTSPSIGGLAGSGNIVLQDGSGAAVTLNVVGNNTDSTYTGVLSGPGGLTKVGTGTFTLTGNNTYACNTSVFSGSLVLTGNTGSLNSASALVFGGGRIRLPWEIRWWFAVAWHPYFRKLRRRC